MPVINISFSAIAIASKPLTQSSDQEYDLIEDRLQRVQWDEKTIAPAIIDIQATTTDSRVNLTQSIDTKNTAEPLQFLFPIEFWV